MRVLGIDPGYDRTGVAVLEGSASAPVLVFSTCIQTSRAEALPERLKALARDLRSSIGTNRPEVCAIESLFFTKNQKTAMGVAAARGAAMLVAAEAGLPVIEYTPQQVKIAVTGYGKSDKGQVAAMLLRLLPASKQAAIDDEVDAIAVALAHLAHARSTYPHAKP